MYKRQVLIGLQLRGAGEAAFDPTEAKKKNPRQIEAVILKNRNGRVGEKIEFEYYPMFNYFTEKGLSLIHISCTVQRLRAAIFLGSK